MDYETEYDKLAHDTTEKKKEFHKIVNLSPTSAMKTEPPKDIKKLLIAMSMWGFSLIMTAAMIVIVHDRIPDYKKYPELPDVLLERVDFKNWALPLCETLLTILVVLNFGLASIHKHGFIMWRRFAVIQSCVMLFRCITISVTSLPLIIATLPRCTKVPKTETMAELAHRIFIILKGMGMSINSAAMCGDYIFSGHTFNALVMTLNFLYYTPKKGSFSFLRNIYKCIWICVIVLLICAHDHYTVDVVLAIFISYITFSYYYLLADNPQLRNRNRTRLPWIMMINYFEENVYCPITNEYQLPCWLSRILVKIGCTCPITKHVDNFV